MSDPVAYFLTWTTFGTWLHGDDRGWVDRHQNQVGDEIRQGSEIRKKSSVAAMKSTIVRLHPAERKRVEATVAQVCEFNRWHLHAVNCRSNHVHVVVTAAETTPERVMNSLKSWCSRDLNAEFGRKDKWWTRHGSTRYLNQEPALEAAVLYVVEGQDRPRARE